MHTGLSELFFFMCRSASALSRSAWMHIFMGVLDPCTAGPPTVPKAFFARKIDFGAKLSREETQERATDVGPVMKRERERERELLLNKEKKRERERKREREGSGRIKGEKFLHPCRDLVLVHADDPNTH